MWESEHSYAVERYILGERPIEWYWEDLYDFICLSGGNVVSDGIVIMMAHCGEYKGSMDRLEERLKVVLRRK